MFKTTIKLLLMLIAVFAFTSSLSAQVLTTRGDFEKQKTVEKQEIPESQLGKFFASAKESAILDDDGKLVFIKLPTANGGEKNFTFEHAKDGKSFIMTDENGVRLQVFLNEDLTVSSVIMPDGEKAVFNWKKTAGNLEPLGTIRFRGKDFSTNNLNPCSTSGNILTDNLDGGGGGNPCRDAVAANLIAAGVCAATGGGLSPACWAAVANAAYHTYRCYEATQ